MAITPPDGQGVGIDVWRAKFFPLDSSGIIKTNEYPITAETPYEGIELIKPKSFQPNLGTARTIAVVAQGRVQTTFLLPPIDPKTAEFHVAYIDLEAFAQLTQVKTRTIGGWKGLAAGTNKQGLEITGAFLISQLQFHTEDGLDAWSSYLLPRVRAAITWPAYNENPIDVTITMSLSAAKKHVWGPALTETNDGATEFTMWPFQSWGQPNLVTWLSDGVETTFLLPENAPANDTFADTFKVYNVTDGALVAGTPAADSFVAGAAQTDGDVLLAVYEQVEG